LFWQASFAERVSVKKRTKHFVFFDKLLSKPCVLQLPTVIRSVAATSSHRWKTSHPLRTNLTRQSCWSPRWVAADCSAWRKVYSSPTHVLFIYVYIYLCTCVLPQINTQWPVKEWWRNKAATTKSRHKSSLVTFSLSLDRVTTAAVWLWCRQLELTGRSVVLEGCVVPARQPCLARSQLGTTRVVVKKPDPQKTLFPFPLKNLLRSKK